MIKKILIAFVAVVILIQFIRPEKNESNDMTYAVSKEYSVPANVENILSKACYDCHSNKTEYPWYNNIQPVAFWLNDHVTSGKRHLNFSEFINRPIAVQYHKFEETAEEVEEGHMPLPSYTYMGMHADAKLTEEEKEILVSWAHHQMDSLKANYPADSLVMKRRGPGGPPPSGD